MEVEAKFSIPDHDTLVRLQTAVRFGPYVLGDGKERQVLDRYLDTRTRTLQKRGYACRVRSRNGEWILTVKGLEAAESAVHRRFETEVVLTDEPSGIAADLTEWPAWDGRELISSLIGSEPLEILFCVEQTRSVRDLSRDDRLVAELSIDEGQVVAGGSRQGFRTLEVELMADGTTEDLAVLEAHMLQTWGLAPDTQSKYGLGLALLGEPQSQTQEVFHLSESERARLADMAGQEGDPRLQARARLVLAWVEGLPVRVVCTQIGLSRSWAYELLRRFRSQRLAMFSTELAAPVRQEDLSEPSAPGPSPGEADSDVAVPADTGGPSDAQRNPRVTMAELCERFQVDQARTRWVAAQASALFEATSSIHGLSADRGRLLQAACILCGVGPETVPGRRRAGGGDILLQYRIVELTDMEQRIVAAAIYLHRKPAKRRRLKAPVVATLPSDVQQDALALAAFLRIADGLDYMRSQTTALGPIQVTPAAVEVPAYGPFAAIDAARAQGKADLWDRLFGVPIRFSTTAGIVTEVDTRSEAEPREGRVVPGPLRPRVPGITPDDRLAEAGRKVLHVHLLRMLECEPGTRAGQEPEALHDMRVATRRMRAALRVFGSDFSPRAIRPYAEGLRATAQVLGAVRDQDVLLAKAQAYLNTLPADRAHDLDPLLDAWQAQRNQARDEMAAYLDSQRYQDFAGAFLLFLRSPGDGVRESRRSVPEPVLVRHLAPRLIYSRWARVLAFGPAIEGAPTATLHALRIECKRLRYCLEFLTEVLGSDGQSVIAETVRVQDHLGELHDADVANALLSSFLFAPQADRTSSPVIAPGVVSYLAAEQLELQTLMQTFPAKWTEFARPEVRRWLANAVAVL